MKIVGITTSTTHNPAKIARVKTVNGITPDDNGNVQMQVVKYGEAQELTDEERMQARQNIAINQYDWRLLNLSSAYGNKYVSVYDSDGIDIDKALETTSTVSSSYNALQGFMIYAVSTSTRAKNSLLTASFSKWVNEFEALAEALDKTSVRFITKSTRSEEVDLVVTMNRRSGTYDGFTYTHAMSVKHHEFATSNYDGTYYWNHDTSEMYIVSHNPHRLSVDNTGGTYEGFAADAKLTNDRFAELEKIVANHAHDDTYIPIPSKAEVGQIIVVTEVDEDGKPTAWEAADLPTGGAQADWDAAEGEAGHIRNRTHWVEVTPETVLEETTLEMDESAGEMLYSGDVTLEAGKTYNVTFNGTTYACEAVDGAELSDELAGYVLVGNYQALIGGDTGEPFICVNLPGEGLSFMYVSGEDSSCTATITARNETIHKLDNKFIDAEWMAVMVDGTETVLEEKEYTFGYSSGKASIELAYFTVSAGQKFCVVYDGVEYACIVSAAYFDGAAVFYIGNGAIWTDQLPETDHPFVIAIVPSYNVCAVIIPAEETETHTIALSAVVPVPCPIPEEFLPTPPVTSVNGQTGDVTLEIPDVPEALPNPYALTINGISYDGSKAKTVYTSIGKSVLAYGAKADGATDDTEAFQTALAENRVVYVPGGTYLLSGELVIGNNCTLELSQDAVLDFTLTSGNCITLGLSSYLKGNHGTVRVLYAFEGNVVSADTASTELAEIYTMHPWTKWDPQWKYGRYVTDLNITKPDSRGFHYSLNGDTCGTAVYIRADGTDDTHFMWGIHFSGLRIAGAFSYGIRGVCENEGWLHEMRIEAFIDACETGVSLEGCNNAYVSAIVQPRRAYSLDEVYSAYAKYGIKLVDSKNVDLSGSRVWDWYDTNTLWTEDGEYQHIAMYGQCRGLILNDFLYYEQSTYDIRDLIYTDTESNLENMTILQEPFTRWFHGIGGLPHFYDGIAERELVMKKDYFDTERVQNYTDVLALATDADGNVYNDVGYKKGAYFDGSGTDYESGYGYYVKTGYIPVACGDVIHTKDISFDYAISIADACMKIGYFRADHTIITLNSCVVMAGGSGTYYQTYERTDEGIKVTINDVPDLEELAYVRFIFHRNDFGSDPVIAINEEIKFLEEGFLLDSVKVKGDNVYLYSPGGSTFKLVVDDDGGLSAEAVEV